MTYQNAGASLTGEEVQIAFAAIGISDPHRLARMFDVDPRTIWRWKKDGAPPHVSIAIDELLAGFVSERGVKYLLRRIGRSRDDGNRYRQRMSSPASSIDSASA